MSRSERKHQKNIIGGIIQMIQIYAQHKRKHNYERNRYRKEYKPIHQSDGRGRMENSS